MLLFVLLLETVLLGVAAFRVAAWAQGSSQVSDWTLRYRYPRKR